MIDIEAIGKRLKEFREIIDYKQVKFAEQLDITQQTLSQLENGRVQISLNILTQLTERFDISYDWILFGKGNMYKSGSTNEDSKKGMYETNLAGCDLSAAEPEPNYPRNKPASYEAALLYIEFLELLIERTLKKLIINFKIE